MECKICNIEVSSIRGLSIHLKKHEIKLVDYYIQYENFKNPQCVICNNPTNIRSGLIFYKTCQNKKCILTNAYTRKHTELTKQHISIKRKKYLDDNKCNAWMTRRKNHISYPEKYFMDVILNNFTDKNYIREFPFFRYSIDFAWVHKKIAFEIDGKQHELEKMKASDIRKDTLLKEHGWTIIRIKWSEFIQHKSKFIESMKQVIDSNEYTMLYDTQEMAKRYISLSKLKVLESNKRGNILRANWGNQNRDRVSKVLNSDIDFSKFGWVSKLAILLDMQPQKINNWIKKHIPDFYNDNCYKRNVNITKT